jgi:hypothetical protein
MHVTFAKAAAELRQREIERLKEATVPRLEAIRSMTPSGFRAIVSLMLDRLGFEVLNEPTAQILLTRKDGKHLVSMCATPADEKEPSGILRPELLKTDMTAFFPYRRRSSHHAAFTSPLS